jgi:hypothetical protein
MNNISRPRDGRKAFEHVVSEFFSREVAVFEKGACLHFNVANWAKLLNQSPEGVQRANWLMIGFRRSAHASRGYRDDSRDA